MMKNKRLFSTTILIGLLIGMIAGCGSGRQSFDELVTPDSEIRVYEIFGMDCPGCHGGVENLIGKVEGVLASKANWEKGTLQVLIADGSNVTDEIIFEAIKKANFTPGKRLK